MRTETAPTLPIVYSHPRQPGWCVVDLGVQADGSRRHIAIANGRLVVDYAVDAGETQIRYTHRDGRIDTYPIVTPATPPAERCWHGGGGECGCARRRRRTGLWPYHACPNCGAPVYADSLSPEGTRCGRHARGEGCGADEVYLRPTATGPYWPRGW